MQKERNSLDLALNVSHRSFFSEFELLPHVKISVVIPVKNEEAHILNALSAFSTQKDIFGEDLNFEKFEILILANNCSDNSVAYIKDFQQKNPSINIYLKEIVLPPEQANIGYVRRLLMENAYQRLCQNGGGIIMTTDGDSTVAADWIAQTFLEIKNGADAVGGRILLFPEELKNMDEFTAKLHIKDENYQLLVAELEAITIKNFHNPTPTHHQYFNGSFAVTTDCYAKAGGIPNVTNLEDCAFFERLQWIDAKVRHSPKVVTHTSARYIGRTEFGLSYQLNVWKNLGRNNQKFEVESCMSILDRLLIKRKLMDLWETRNRPELEFYKEIKKIAPAVVCDATLHNSFKESVFFGKWYAEITQLNETNKEKKYPLVSIDEAIRDLKKTISNYSVPALSQTSIR